MVVVHESFLSSVPRNVEEGIRILIMMQWRDNTIWRVLCITKPLANFQSLRFALILRLEIWGRKKQKNN